MDKDIKWLKIGFLGLAIAVSINIFSIIKIGQMFKNVNTDLDGLINTVHNIQKEISDR